MGGQKRLGISADSAEEAVVLDSGSGPATRLDPGVAGRVLRELIERCPAYIYVKDGELRHRYGNRTLLDLYGITLDEFIGMRSVDFFSPDVAASLEDRDRRVLDGADPGSPRRLHVSDDDGGQWLLDLKYRVEGPDGPMLAGLVIDVGGQVAAERQLVELLEFERLVADLSRRLSSATVDDLDQTITEGLEGLARHLGLERAHVTRLADGRLRVTHCWIDPDLPPEAAEFVQELDPSQFYVSTAAVAGETLVR